MEVGRRKQPVPVRGQQIFDAGQGLFYSKSYADVGVAAICAQAVGSTLKGSGIPFIAFDTK